MFTMCYQLVPDRYLRTKREKVNEMLGNLTMQDGRTQTNIITKELPPETYYQRKF